MEKECTKCHETKPLEAFNKQAQGKYGHASTCRDCAKAWKAEYRREHADKVLESKRKWETNNPGKASEQAKRWAEKNPDRHRASIDRAQKKYKEESLKTAVNQGKRWTDDDFAILVRRDLTVLEMSKILGRTYASTQVKRNLHLARLDRLAMIDAVQKRLAG
jgi:hypothetical protein